ncbi:MAG: YbaY family lipoprotein [Caulobacterales bacterium]|nr:YbaY family lipoprotein [Caulobacterales bacterium]MCA0373767.1 YbaY family lipoprotein [Pseudomonadota bacterium]
MRNIISILFIGFLCACAVEAPKTYADTFKIKPDNQNTSEILFLVKFEDESKFGENEKLIVTLYDGGLMDAPMQPIATFTDITDKNYGPRSIITGRFSFNKADFDKLSMPSFSARLEKDGKLIAINTANQSYSGKTLAETIIINRLN